MTGKSVMLGRHRSCGLTEYQALRATVTRECKWEGIKLMDLGRKEPIKVDLGSQENEGIQAASSFRLEEL